MPEKPVFETAFAVNMRDYKGNPNIFIKHITPSCIVSVHHGEHGCADLTLRSSTAEHFTVCVTQTVDEINLCIDECKRRDAAVRE